MFCIRSFACRSTLEVLQDRVSPRPYYEIEQVLRQELGDAAVEDVFAEFQQEAIAAASLAQALALFFFSRQEGSSLFLRSITELPPDNLLSQPLTSG